MKVRLATQADDAILRQILRDNPMLSWVSMATEREPAFFSEESRRQGERAVLVEDTRENAVGMYTCAPHHLWLGGEQVHAGYLSGLRVREGYRGRLKYIKAGYASLPILTSSPCGYWYTCVANENRPAKRLLEAGIAGLPVYKDIGDIVTLAIPRSRRQERKLWRHVRETEISALCKFYNDQVSGCALAHRLTEEIVRSEIKSFYVCVAQRSIIACMAIIDQRHHKQCVAKAYKFPLNRLLPLYNVYARIFKKIRLPDIGESLEQAFIGYFACGSDDVDYIHLLQDALNVAPVEVCAITIDANDGRLESIRKNFSPAEYAAKVYLVGFGSLPNLRSGRIFLNGGML